MPWQHTPYTWFLMMVSGVGIWLAIYAWRRRSTPGGRYFALMMLALAEWTLAVALHHATVEIPIKIWWAKVQWLGVASVSPLWLSFAISYSHKENWLTRRNLWLLWISPLCIVAMAWTNEWHRLLWPEITPSLQSASPLFIRTTPLTYGHGPGFWLAMIYNHILMISGAVLLLYTALQLPRLYRRQAIALVVAIAIVLSVNIAYVAGWVPIPGIDFTSTAFMLGGIVIVWGIFRFQLLDVVPVARAALVENMSDGVLVLDAQQRVVDINLQARRFINIDTGVVGQQAEAIFVAMPELLAQFRDDKTTQTEVVLNAPDPPRWLEVHIAPLYSRRGQFTGWLVVLHDITVRKRAEVALHQAKESAEAANRAKSAFLANMSHELRTPLTAILGYSELMTYDPNLTRDQRENLEIIGRSGEHLLALINDVLELSKIEAGHIELQPESFDLYYMLSVLEEMFHPRAEQKGLQLVFDRAADVPRFVYADQGKLRQVLINLLGNAVKFTEQGSINLRVRQVPIPATSPGDRLTAMESLPATLYFTIQDTGVGIAPDEIDAVFDVFVQTASGKHSGKGTGLGMPISRRYVRLMGGDLTASSPPPMSNGSFSAESGQGTCFQFDIPVKVVAATTVETAPPARRVTGLASGQPIYRLLIAEDSEANRRLLVKLLRPLGFEVRTVENGQEAIEVWKAWQPHLIWMDLRMPVLSGDEAVRQIKSAPHGADTVIIALTASVFEEQRTEVLAGGCDDFIRKPFREHEIFDALRRHLGVRFIYEAVTSVPDAAASVSPKDLRAAIETLPAAWAADLYQAIVALDTGQMLALVESVRPQAPRLAATLAQWVHDFEHEKLMALIAPEA